jgi:hypothetical protein
MNTKALIKWILLLAAGLGCLALGLVSYIRRNYTWILVGFFTGCFLVSASWKKIRLLMKAGKALKAGKESVVIMYRDHNLKEYETAVIPLYADTMYFYGYALQKQDIKVFRWEKIIRVTERGAELNRETLIQKASVK